MAHVVSHRLMEVERLSRNNFKKIQLRESHILPQYYVFFSYFHQSWHFPVSALTRMLFSKPESHSSTIFQPSILYLISSLIFLWLSFLFILLGFDNVTLSGKQDLLPVSSRKTAVEAREANERSHDGPEGEKEHVFFQIGKKLIKNFPHHLGAKIGPEDLRIKRSIPFLSKISPLSLKRRLILTPFSLPLTLSPKW